MSVAEGTFDTADEARNIDARAAAELAAGRVASALVLLYPRLEAAPGDATAWTNMSAALLADSDDGRARDAALQAIVRDPGQGAAWANFFMAEAAGGRAVEACLLVEALKRHAQVPEVVTALAPFVNRVRADAAELLTIAALLAGGGHVGLAQRLVARSTREGLERSALALRCAHLLEDDEGVSRWGPEVLAERPLDADALRALAELALRHGMDADAAVMGERLVRDGGGELDQLMLAWALARLGQETACEAVMGLVRAGREARRMAGVGEGAELVGASTSAGWGVRVAAWLVPAAVAGRRMAVALMAAEPWSEAVTEADGARVLVQLALEMEAAGSARHALAALLMAERRSPGTVSDEDAGRIGAAAQGMMT